MEDEDKAMRMMPSGWGAPEVFFQKYLRALKSNPDPSLEDVLYAEDGMKSPRTRDEFINQYKLPSDYFTTDNTTRGKYNEEWRKRKALTLPKKPELYPGSADIPQPVTDVYPLPPVQFDLSRVGRFGDGDKLPTARKAEERSDNTRVASGRPQVVLNRIPWNAGRGPAADSPIYLLDANITSNPNILTGAPTFLPGRFMSPKIVRQFRRYNLGITSNPYIRQQAYENTLARTGGDVVKANEVANSVANHELLAQFLRDRFTNNEEWLYRTLVGGALAGASYAGVKMNPNK